MERDTLGLADDSLFYEIDIRNMAQETLDSLVPIADRLSLGDLRRRLEDACFQALDPQGYASLMEKVSPIQADDDKCLQILLAGVQRVLNNNSIKGRVQGRTKRLHGIRRKMNWTGRFLNEIMDRVGLRVIVASVPECYTVHDYLQLGNLENSKETVVKVNGKTVRMNHVLKVGDSIETQCCSSPGTEMLTPFEEYALIGVDECANDNRCHF